MNTRLLILLALCCHAGAAAAQTIDDRLARGRAALAGRDLGTADAYFAQILALAPSHEQANVLRALTRLLVIPSQPSGSNFLTRLGIPAEGRNLYDWTAMPPLSPGGAPQAPDGVNANESTAFLRTVLLPELIASEAQLAQVGNTNFLMFLSRRETKLSDVFVDYGDLQLLRAMGGFLEYLIYTAHSWNLDVQLTALHSLCSGPILSAQWVAEEYPQLLTFATTNDLSQARQAFTTAVDRYLDASARIRNRSPQLIRLFNWDAKRADDESKFRQLLLELRASLDGPVAIAGQTNFTVHFARHFTGLHSPRDFVPRIADNSVVAGTWPDPTFDGLIGGLNSVVADRELSHLVPVIPQILPGPVQTAGQITLLFNTVTGRVYAVEFSSDLLSWVPLTNFLSSGATFAFTDSFSEAGREGFYRLSDLTGTYVFAQGRVKDACSAAGIPGATVSGGSASTLTDGSGNFALAIPGPLDLFDPVQIEIEAPGYASTTWELWSRDNSGLEVTLLPNASPPPPNDNISGAIVLPGLPAAFDGTICGGTLEAGEPDHGIPAAASVWWTWSASVATPVTLHADWERDFNFYWISVFIRTPLGTLSRIALGGVYVEFPAEAGTQYWIAVVPNGDPSHVWLQMGAPPEVSLLQPEDGGEYSGDTLPFDLGVLDPDGDLARIEIRSNGHKIGVLTNSPWTFTWENVAPGFYCVDIFAFDGQENFASSSACFAVRPGNDNFADRLPITTGESGRIWSNEEATEEPGEPIHGDVSSGYSVWWAWRAERSGPVTLSVLPRNKSGPTPIVAIYTGNALENLSPVASNALDGRVVSPQVSWTAVAGVEYQVAVAGVENGQEFFLRWTPAVPARVELAAPLPDSRHPSTNLDLSVVAADPDGEVLRVDYYLLNPLNFDPSAFLNGDYLIGSSTTPPFGLRLGYLTGGDYVVWAEAIDNAGLVAVSEFIPFGIDEAPSFVTQPASSRATLEVSVVFQAAVRGTPPFTFQWFKDGQPIPGAVESEYEIFSVQEEDAGVYVMLAQNAFGSTPSSNAVLTVVEPPTLAEALDQPGWPWSTSSEAPWTGIAHASHDGEDAAQSGLIFDEEESWVETTLAGPGTVQFWWKVSSEEGHDYLEFYLDDVLSPGRISGETDWVPVCVSLTEGDHRLRWRFTKDLTTSEGADAGWVDEVTLLGPQPNFVKQPVGLTVAMGATVVFMAEAVGSPPITYQWRKDGVELPGATSAMLTLANVQPTDAGIYTVVARNAVGATTSSPARLMVEEIITLEVALDAPGAVWTSGGNVPWGGQARVTHDGVDAAESGDVEDLELSWVETSVVGPGTLTFWWKVSSEPIYDVLEFRLDGARMGNRLSGEPGWQNRVEFIPAGSHTLRWVYRKDESFSEGENRAWLDQVSFVLTGP